MDSFQSFDSIQAFDGKGYEAEIISVDRPMSAYDTLKGAVYDGRLKMYDYPIAIDEQKRLEYDVLRKKVDHPAEGEKDVADAICAVVYTLTTKYKGEPLGIFSGEGVSKEDEMKAKGKQSWIMMDDEMFEMEEEVF